MLQRSSTMPSGNFQRTSAHFRAAFNHPEFKQTLAHSSSSTVASPHLFTRLNR